MKRNGTTIREATPQESTAWNEIVGRFRHRRIFHTSQWIRSLENCTGGQALRLVFESDDGGIVGCLPGLVITKGPMRIFGSPMPGWQTSAIGPLFDESRISPETIVSLLVPHLERVHSVHHIEIVSNRLSGPAMTDAGFAARPEYTYRAELFPGDENRNLKGMKPSARRNIRRGSELGLEVRLTDESGFADEVYDQITEVFLRGGNVVPFGPERIAEFISKMRDAGSLLAAGVYLPDKKTCIATALATVYADELALWSWTHRTEHRWYRPTEMMTWELMRRAMSAGCTTFDLMGRGEFKRKFGARMVTDKTRWIRSRYAWMTPARDIAERLYRFQQRVRGRFRSASPTISTT